MRDEDEIGATAGAPGSAQPGDQPAADDHLTSRRNMLRIAALGGVAVVAVRPGMAQAAVSAITCSVPVPTTAQAGKWIKSDGTVVNANTANSYAPPSSPLKGEDVKNSLKYSTKYPGYNQNQTNAYNEYIKKLTVGKQGYTCYSSLQSPMYQ